MSWNSLSVTFSVNKEILSCGKREKATAKITVTGETDGQGAHYRAYCYQEESGFDDKLFLSNRVTVGSNADYNNDHTFTIECDDSCKVKGPDGNSGDSEAKLYAYVEGTDGIEATSSEKITVKCK